MTTAHANIWKVRAEGVRGIGPVEDALRAAFASLSRADAPADQALDLIRVDLNEQAATIYLTGGERVIRAFADALPERAEYEASSEEEVLHFD